MTGETVATLATAVEEVRKRTAAACARSGRDPGDVTVVAAAKTMPVEQVRAAIAAGITDIAENRVQEALPKVEALRAEGHQARWHFIGHLQRNKARQAAGAFDVIQAVDSAALLQALDNAAGAPLECFVQVNVAGDEQKYGIDPGELPVLLREAAACANVHVTGLMTIGRQVAHPEDARPYFRALRELARDHGLDKLSMGMSEDFEVAIEEGATHVRIGRALFGERSV